MLLNVVNFNEEGKQINNGLFIRHIYLAERISSFFVYKFSSLNITYDDIFQEALMGLSIASKKYNDKLDTSFKTYATSVINRSILKYLRKFNTNKVVINEESMLYDDEKYSYSKDPLDVNISLEIQDYIIFFKHSLKFEEALIFEMRLNGFNNSDISLLLNIDYNKVVKVYSKTRTRCIEYLKSL